MSLHDYLKSQQLETMGSFAALLMAAMRKADSDNMDKLAVSFPEITRELLERYDAPGGAITDGERAYIAGLIDGPDSPFFYMDRDTDGPSSSPKVTREAVDDSDPFVTIHYLGDDERVDVHDIMSVADYLAEEDVDDDL